MPCVIAVGVQWGDEGKGKIVDYLTERADLVVRFQGGSNAGHTIIVEGQKAALKLIPSGILRPSSRCLLASGVVLDPWELKQEIARLAEIGIEVNPARFGIAPEVALVLPYHKAVDAQREVNRGKTVSGTIGTTGRGIGPAYEDSVSRSAIRLGDLFDEENLETLVKRNVAEKNAYLKEVLKSDTQFCPDETLGELKEIAVMLKPHLTNVSREIEDAVSKKQYVMFEGAQGCLLDINHGTYPFVTSSNTVSSYACVSAGLSPRKINLVLGICKAYSTRVGSGPFPTEDHGVDGERLREVGKEFGTVTGRPRRCGWFDNVAVRRAVRLNGIDELILTKLDVLSGFDTVKLATGYDLNGETIDDLPVLASDLEKVTASYEEMPGWTEDITNVRSFEELPVAAQNVMKRIEELSGCKVGGFSVGPERSQTIIMSEEVRGFADA